MIEQSDQTPSSRLYRRISLMRWLALSFGLFVVLMHQLLEGFVRRSAVPSWEMIELVYGILISLTTWLIIS
ncbi:MAG: hypothetical protein GWP61_17730 [Chloroflexi bacterium]|jgi:hypothetical protein|nr:hypothetical protein [Chloroflexota bacterium]